MIRKNLVLFVWMVITFFIFWSNADATDVAKEGLNIQFNKGMLSVDIKDIDTRVVFKALEEKGKIEIFNKKILPDKKISIKFKELKTEEGIKRIMQACGVKNYVVISRKEVKPGESKIAKLILIKAEVGPAPVVEKEAEVREAPSKEIEKAQKEAIVKTITPMLEGTDEETREAIIKDIREGEVEAFED
jgi:hypothetical protein